MWLKGYWKFQQKLRYNFDAEKRADSVPIDNCLYVRSYCDDVCRNCDRFDWHWSTFGLVYDNSFPDYMFSDCR
ncbi:21187_t:CDS:2, partial [Racocetra persica]